MCWATPVQYLSSNTCVYTNPSARTQPLYTNPTQVLPNTQTWIRCTSRSCILDLTVTTHWGDFGGINDGIEKKVGDLFCRGAQGEQIRSLTFFLSSIIFTSKITPMCRNGRVQVEFSLSRVRALPPHTSSQCVMQ